MREFLRDFDAYAPLAGLLRVNGRVAGFSAGEIVGDTLIIHIEKADIAYEGVYQVLVNDRQAVAVIGPSGSGNVSRLWGWRYRGRRSCRMGGRCLKASKKPRAGVVWCW